MWVGVSQEGAKVRRRDGRLLGLESDPAVPELIDDQRLFCRAEDLVIRDGEGEDAGAGIGPDPVGEPIRPIRTHFDFELKIGGCRSCIPRIHEVESQSACRSKFISTRGIR